MMWLIGNSNRFSVLGFRFSASSSTEHRAPSAEFGFTLVELMVTVVVVTVGLVLIIQGFTIAAGALSSMQNRILAAQFLDSKMQELEILAKHDSGVKEDEDGDRLTFEGKSFDWKLNIANVESEEVEIEFGVVTKEEDKPIDFSKDLNFVELKISWVEKNSPKDLSVSTYLKNKKT